MRARVIPRRGIWHSDRENGQCGQRGKVPMKAPEIVTAKATAQGGTPVPTSPVQVTEPFAVIIFGATGALTHSKLIPALFSLWLGNFFGAPFVVIGVGRRDKNDEQFRDVLRNAAETHGRTHAGEREDWESFAKNVYYHRADFTAVESYSNLSERLQVLEKEHGLSGNRLFYLATDPDRFSLIVEQLSAARLALRETDQPWTRLVIEKPFGKDLASARALDKHVLRFFREEQVYRIDHYLGKETVQNLLSFRFGNAIFDSLFNSRYVDHVQITMAETGGMEGRRGAYYDGAGALRDVVQNHLLQLLALVAMEPPASLGAKDIRDEKVKVLRNLVPRDGREVNQWAVRGQYGVGQVDGQPGRAYREEEAVAADSSTETYVALRVGVDTWRWAGVPFLLRSGKRLAQRVTEISIEFKQPPLRLFSAATHNGNLCDRTCNCGTNCRCGIAQAEPSVLAFRIQPDEGISLSFSAKQPGMQLSLQPVRMDFLYGQSFKQTLPEAYERLLLDALRGDATLFMRSDEVTTAWEFVTPILEAWERQPAPRFPDYAAGSWGPAEADHLLIGCQRAWRQPERCGPTA
jgi:glucose-6-phosphate 1-dehydrogenase